MADAKKCDICGMFYIPQYTVEVGYRLTFVNAFMPNVDYDMCPQCTEELTKFVQSMKEKNND